MSRYYFDFHDGFRLVRDDVGSECSGQEAIRTEAMHVLPAIARDSIPKDGDRQAFTVLVRNKDNLTVYTATMTFAGLWLGEKVPSRVETEDESLD